MFVPWLLTYDVDSEAGGTVYRVDMRMVNDRVVFFFLLLGLRLLLLLRLGVSVRVLCCVSCAFSIVVT